MKQVYHDRKMQCQSPEVPLNVQMNRTGVPTMTEHDNIMH